MGDARACAGTDVTVRRTVGWYKLELTAEEIVAKIPHLTLAQVYAALAYYHANQEDIAKEETVAEHTARAAPEGNDDSPLPG